MAEELIQPVVAEVPAVEITPIDPQAEAAPAEGGADLPDELLQIPVFQALMSGAPGAVSAPIATLDKMPEGKIISENAEALKQSGFGFYRALDKTTGVIFNGLFLAPEQLQQADQAGKLMEVAPAFSVVNDAAAKAGAINPALTAQTPSGPPTAQPPVPPQSSSGMLPKPAPASAHTKAASARLKNLAPSSPTSGPTPGRGRILDGLLRPAL